MKLDGQPISFDVETVGNSRFDENARVFSFSIMRGRSTPEVYRLDKDEDQAARGTRLLEDLASGQNDGAILVMHNAKYDMGFLERALGRRVDWCGLPGGGVRFVCTHKMAHLALGGEFGLGLKRLLFILAGYPVEDERAVKKEVRRAGGDWSKVPEDVMHPYQVADAERCMLLFDFLRGKFTTRRRMDCLRAENDLIPVTMHMEERGVMLARGRTKKLMRDIEVKIARAYAEINAIAGKRINPNAQDDVRRLLYETCGLKIEKRTEKTNQPATDKEVLLSMWDEGHGHPVAGALLRFRSYSRGLKMLQSYLDAADTNDLLHPDINTCAAVTGRESCRSPNLQNVQKEGVLTSPFAIPARSAFRPKPGYVNILIDYAGIEMRLLVHYSGDKRMLDEFLRPGGDGHALAAEVFYGDDFRRVRGARRKTLRNAAKAANFAICYGASPRALARTLMLDEKTVQTRFALYRRMFPDLVHMHETYMRQVQHQGKIETFHGRLIQVPRGKAHVGVNFLIQGTAADILKRAQVRVHAYLERATGGEAGMILPIHDEIIIEYPRKRLADLGEILRGVKERMIDFDFSLPLDVEARLSTSRWDRTKEIRID